MIEKHSFEFSVRVETQNYRNDVVDCQHADNGKLKRGTCRTSVVNASDRACLNAETDYIDEREEVDRDVDHVKSETTEVHLCEGAEQNSDVNQLVDAWHYVAEAQHDRECELNKTANH